MAKRTKGLVFLLIGCLLLMSAGGWYWYNVAEDQAAGRQAADLLQQMDAAQNDREPQGEKAPTIVVDGTAFCGKIVVERLGIELPIYDEWDYARLKSAPCRYAGSAEADNLIVAGHNYQSHFGPLDKVQVGDTVVFADACGTQHQYSVCEVVTLDGTAVSDMHAGGWDLTLFTCNKSGKQRVTVRCERK